MTNLILLEIDFQKNFLRKLSFGYPEILNINSVSRLNNLKIVRGKEVTKCKKIISGLCFFSKINNGKKDSIKITK